MAIILKTQTGMIPAHETDITFTDVLIEEDSIIEIYYNDNNVYTVETSQTNNSVHIVTNDHDNPVGVKLLINNVSSFSPYNDSYLRNQIDALDDIVNASAEAIGELQEDIGNNTMAINQNSVNIGDLSTLLTTEKNNLVDALNENFTNVSNGKILLADAITDKGVDTSATDTFETMATNISNISGGGGGDPIITKYYAKKSSGNNTLNTDITIPKSGKFIITSSVYMDVHLTVKKNNITVTPIDDIKISNFTWFQRYEIDVNKNDEINLYTYGTGNSYYYVITIMI